MCVVFRHIWDLLVTFPSNTSNLKPFRLQGQLLLRFRSGLGMSKFVHYCSFICFQRWGSTQLTFSFELAIAAQSSTGSSGLVNYTVRRFLNFCWSKYISLSNHYFGVTRRKSAPTTGRMIVAVCSVHSSQAQESHPCFMFDLRRLGLFRSHKHQCNYLRCYCSHLRLRRNFSIHLDCIGRILPDTVVISCHMIGFGNRATNNYFGRTHCTTTVNSLIEIVQD